MPETKSKEGKKSEDNTAHLACPIEVDRLCMLVFGAIVVVRKEYVYSMTTRAALSRGAHSQE